ncbi:MAG TPA: pilus assembly protein [Rhodobacteraceae bacterium]|nr:pilus assembly protein [Paracoccaceae bacterium]
MTQRFGRKLAARLRKLRKREDGNATIEFVIMFPLVFTLFLSSFELGLMSLRQVMLERSVDIVVRQLRLGYLPNPTQETLRTMICNRAALIPDCLNSLMIELRPVSTVTWEPLGSDTICKNRSQNIEGPPLHPGSAHEMILVRVCASVVPFFPTSKLGMSLARDELGGYALVASSAFVNEPR